MTAININDAIDTSVIIIVHQIFCSCTKTKTGECPRIYPKMYIPQFSNLGKDMFIHKVIPDNTGK